VCGHHLDANLLEGVAPDIPCFDLIVDDQGFAARGGESIQAAIYGHWLIFVPLIFKICDLCNNNCKSRICQEGLQLFVVVQRN
jgi:hypothetical protein